MAYLTLQENLLAALRNTGLFNHVAAHTQPPETINAAFTKGLPAALVRLIQLPWLPSRSEENSYYGQARVEFTFLALPNTLEPAVWETLVETAKHAVVFADVAAPGLLLEESTQPGPNLQYRVEVSYKIVQTLTP